MFLKNKNKTEERQKKFFL